MLACVSVTLRAESASAKNDAPAKDEAKAPSVAEQLVAAKQELAKLRERYMDQHPRVKAQLRKIAELENRLADEKGKK